MEDRYFVIRFIVNNIGCLCCFNIISGIRIVCESEKEGFIELRLDRLRVFPDSQNADIMKQGSVMTH